MCSKKTTASSTGMVEHVSDRLALEAHLERLTV